MTEPDEAAEREAAERRALARGWLLLAAKRRWVRLQAQRRRGRRVAAWMAAHLAQRKS